MKIQRKQAVLGAMLALAGGVLVLDRASAGGGVAGPASAAAATAPAALGPTASTAAPVAATPARPAGGDAAVVAVLARAAATAPAVAQMRDALATPASWAPAGAASPQDAAEGRVAERFRAAHQLSAVLRGGARPIAVVDGQPVALGQRVGGLVLRQVGERSAVFEGEGVRVELRLPDGAGL